MEYYKMTRNGVFTPQEYTASQCSGQGHPAYTYVISMIFPSSTQLDDQNMIIDHTFINLTVVQMKPHGTCEEMHPAIFKQVKELLDTLKIDLLGYKCTIQAGANGGTAHMDYYYFSNTIAAQQTVHVAAIL